MQGTENGSTSTTEQVAQARPLVERWLVWSGLVPLPLFLALHLSLELKRAFANDVTDVVRAEHGSFVALSSLVLVWLPLGVHLVLGTRLLLTHRELPSATGADVPKLPRIISRVSAALAGAFVLYHARAYTLSAWLHEADPRDAGFRLLAELSSVRFGIPLAGSLYLLGLLATATHAALALHRALTSEGWLKSDAQRQASARACTAFGVFAFVVGAAAVIRVASGVLLR